MPTTPATTSAITMNQVAPFPLSAGGGVVVGETMITVACVVEVVAVSETLGEASAEDDCVCEADASAVLEDDGFAVFVALDVLDVSVGSAVAVDVVVLVAVDASEEVDVEVLVGSEGVDDPADGSAIDGERVGRPDAAEETAELRLPDPHAAVTRPIRRSAIHTPPRAIRPGRTGVFRTGESIPSARLRRSRAEPFGRWLWAHARGSVTRR